MRPRFVCFYVWKIILLVWMLRNGTFKDMTIFKIISINYQFLQCVYNIALLDHTILPVMYVSIFYKPSAEFKTK